MSARSLVNDHALTKTMQCGTTHSLRAVAVELCSGGQIRYMTRDVIGHGGGRSSPGRDCLGGSGFRLHSDYTHECAGSTARV